MKWYFAARTRHTETLKQLSSFLESKGETINSDWIYIGMLKPFSENVERVREVSVHCTEAVLSADIFVLISDPEGTDMYAELGMALGQWTTTKKPKIYTVGEHAERSVMQLHPAAVHVKTVGDVLRAEDVDLSGFTEPVFV